MRQAIVKIGVPSSVETFLATKGQSNIDSKMVIIDIEEEGLFDIPAFNGLAINIQLQPNWIVWVMTPKGSDGRYVILGIHDNGVTLANDEMIKLDFPTGKAKITIGNNTIETDGSTSWKFNGTTLEVNV